MTLYLIDINVWLAMTWDLHPQHAPAVRWYNARGNCSLLFCRFTMLGFLRLLTNAKVMGDSASDVRGALELYDRWLEDPRVELLPEPRGAEEAFRGALNPFGRQFATKAIADCYLTAFASAAGAQLVTFDRALASAARTGGVTATLIQAA